MAQWVMKTSIVDDEPIARRVLREELESQSSSLSSLVTLASPGISADSNGLFHGLGDHASNSFSMDGQPITDQQSKVFSNQLPARRRAVDGGDRGRSSGRIWRQDQRGDRRDHALRPRRHTAARRCHGFLRQLWHVQRRHSILLTAGRTGAISSPLNGLNTGRFLDGPEFTVMHDHGNEQNVFDRFDFKPSQADTINLNFRLHPLLVSDAQFLRCPERRLHGPGLRVSINGGLGPERTAGGATGSAFEDPDVQYRPDLDASVRIRAPSSPSAAFARQDQYNYYPSANPFADLTPDLQLRNHRPGSQPDKSGAARQRVVRQRHSQLQGRGHVFEDTILTEEG